MRMICWKYKTTRFVWRGDKFWQPSRELAVLKENDKQWVDFRHTHEKVNTEIGKHIRALSASSACTSLGWGMYTNLHGWQRDLRKLPEYREMLGKLSQQWFLAGSHEHVHVHSSA